MNETHINTITDGSQYNETYYEIDNGHIIAWRSNGTIIMQKLNSNYEREGVEIDVCLSGSPNHPNVFRTTTGFTILYKKNDGNMYVKFYDNNCNILQDEYRVNTLTYSNMNSDEQKVFLELNDKFIILWASGAGNNSTTDIYGQLIDKNFTKIGDQFMINENTNTYTKFNPSIINTNNGILICWGMWAPDSVGVWTTHIKSQLFNTDFNPIGNEQTIFTGGTSSARYIRINKINTGYILFWKEGTSKLYAQKMTENLDIDGNLFTYDWVVNTTYINNVLALMNEFAIGTNTHGNVEFQRYDLDFNTIGDKIIVTDTEQLHYESNIRLFNSNGGYFVSWNSDKNDNSGGVYAKMYLYENGSSNGNSTIMTIDTIISSNTARIDRYTMCMNNMLQDYVDLQTIINQITIWNSQGIHLDSAITPLTNQLNTWDQMLDTNINTLQSIFVELKTYDDRISSSTNTIIDDNVLNSKPRLEKIPYLCNLYKQLFLNLKEDIEILNQVRTDISGYITLGVNLGSAITKIDEQINSLNNAINNSINSFENLITKIDGEKETIQVTN